MAKASPAAFWLYRARLLALAVNAVSLWQRLLPAWVTLNLILAAALLILRQSGAAPAALIKTYWWAIFACALFAAWQTCRRPYTQADALLRIETALKLHNRLTCAKEGITPWPPQQATGGRVLRLRPATMLLPLLYSLAFIVAALYWPITAAQTNATPTERIEPAAWTQVADWAELLHEEKLLAPVSLDAFEERLSQLRERPQQEWYSQGSLEAGEALHDEMLLAMQELARQLQTTAALLEQLSLPEQASAPHGQLAEQLGEQWSKLLQQLQNGELAMDAQTLGQLQAMDLTQMNSLSPEQLQAMQERLQQGAQSIGAAAGLSELELEAITLQMSEGFSGNPERGPGAAPLVINPQGSSLQTSKHEGISNLDIRNALPAETIGTASRPGNDTPQAPFESGQQTDAAAQGGTGGSAVWQETHTPQERHILERYFK